MKMNNREHLDIIIESLRKLNMKISLGKSLFFQKEVELLGFKVAENVIRKRFKDNIRISISNDVRTITKFFGNDWIL